MKKLTMDEWIEDADELYVTVMSHKEFHNYCINPYIKFIHKHVHASSAFINDKLREYCNKINLKYEVATGIECVKMIDEYIKEEYYNKEK